jgi:hypothetical protein
MFKVRVLLREVLLLQVEEVLGGAHSQSYWIQQAQPS